MGEKAQEIKGEFRLEMPCVVIRPEAGPPMRALILAQSEMEPYNPQWVNCGLALIDGRMVIKPVRRAEFLKAQQTRVTLVEAPDLAGAPLIIVPRAG